MKISFKNQATEIKNNEDCLVTINTINDDMIDFAIIKISGRYPSTHCAVNLISKELAYIQEGNGKIFIEGKEYQLNVGDSILIEPGEKFYWEGDMKLFVTCQPAWKPDQHQMVNH